MKLETAHGILAAVYLVTMMLSIGIGAAAADRAVEARRAHVWIHARGLALSLVLVPAIALLSTRALRPSSAIAVALLLVAASPGGRFAPHLARVAHGDILLATEATAIVTKLAVLSAPLTAMCLLRMHLLELPVLRIILEGLLIQVLPLSVGQALRRARPDLADRIERPLRAAVTAIAVAALVALLHSSGLGSLRLLGDRGWVAVLLVAFATLTLGWLMGGPSPRRRRAIAAGGMSRNLALALLLAHVASPGEEVKLAVFGVWWVFLGVSYLFALVSARTGGPTP